MEASARATARAQLRYSGCTLHYWRTKDKAEVDFVVRCGDRVVPVEVKYRSRGKPQVTRSLRSFIERYEPPEAYVVTPDYEDTARVRETEVFFVPFYKISEIVR